MRRLIKNVIRVFALIALVTPWAVADDAARSVPIAPVLAPSATFKTGGEVAALAFSPDGSRLATATGWGGKLRIWDVSSGALKLESEQDVGADQLVWATDGNLVAAVLEFGSVALVDTGTGKSHVLPGSDKIKVMAWQTDGKLLACGDADGTITIWDLASERPTATLKGGANIVSMTLSDDGNTLVVRSTGVDYHATKTDVWSVAHKRILRSTDSDYGYAIWLGPGGNPLMEWRQRTLVRADKNTGPDGELLSFPGQIGAAAFSADGRITAVLEKLTIDPGIYVFDTAGQKLLAVLSGPHLTGGSYALAVSADGKHVAAATADGAGVWTLPSDPQAVPAAKPAAARLDDIWEGSSRPDKAKVIAALKAGGTPPEKIDAAVKDRIDTVLPPQVIYDFKSDGTGSVTETNLATAMSMTRPVRWAVTADRGENVGIRLTELAARGQKAKEPRELTIRFLGNWMLLDRGDSSDSTFESTVWLHRTPRHYLPEYAAELEKARQAMVDMTSALTAVTDADTAAAAVPKIVRFEKASQDSFYELQRISFGASSPSLWQIERAQSGEYWRDRAALDAAVLEVRLHPDWEKAMKPAIDGRPAGSEVEDVPPSATAAEIIAAYKKDDKTAASQYGYKSLLIEGKVRRLVVPGTAEQFTCTLELVGNDQPDGEPASIYCKTWKQNVSNLKPGQIVRVAGTVGTAGGGPPSVVGMSGCFYVRPK